MRLVRAIAVWFMIVLLESLNGTVRALWLVPRVGDLPARQPGVLTGSLLILAVAWLFVGGIGVRTDRAPVGVGLVSTPEPMA